jgi:hypothetical protein
LPFGTYTLSGGLRERLGGSCSGNDRIFLLELRKEHPG